MSDTGASRERSLEEFIAALPVNHRAAREYRDLVVAASLPGRKQSVEASAAMATEWQLGFAHAEHLIAEALKRGKDLLPVEKRTQP